MSFFLKMTGLSLLVLCVVGAGQAPTATEPVQDDSWKVVTVVYTGDVGGKIDPCG